MDFDAEAVKCGTAVLGWDTEALNWDTEALNWHTEAVNWDTEAFIRDTEAFIRACLGLPGHRAVLPGRLVSNAGN
ncbi:MAG: hypothetical protein CFE23_01205 [Flavobacterium sp. BFFFF1]|nr:MAG: hypothetical protein CFE23_01205 [Flavobacterium sp. BFFFF1]